MRGDGFGRSPAGFTCTHTRAERDTHMPENIDLTRYVFDPVLWDNEATEFLVWDTNLPTPRLRVVARPLTDCYPYWRGQQVVAHGGAA